MKNPMNSLNSSIFKSILVRRECSRNHQLVKTQLIRTLFSIKKQRENPEEILTQSSDLPGPTSFPPSRSALDLASYFPEKMEVSEESFRTARHAVLHFACLCPYPVHPGCDTQALRFHQAPLLLFISPSIV